MRRSTATAVVAALLSALFALTSAVVIVPHVVVDNGAYSADVSSGSPIHLRIPASPNAFRRNLIVTADATASTSIAFWYSRCFMTGANGITYGFASSYIPCAVGASCTQTFPIFSDPEDPCDTYIRVTASSTVSMVLSFDLVAISEGPLPFYNITDKTRRIIEVSAQTATQVTTGDNTGFWVPVGRIRPASFADDVSAVVLSYSSGFSSVGIRVFAEPPWSISSQPSLYSLTPGRTYYLYASIGKQAPINITALLMPTVYTNVVSANVDSTKLFLLRPYEMHHVAIEFDSSITTPDEGYFELNASRAFAVDESVGYSFGYNAWGDRAGQGGGIIYQSAPKMTREARSCSRDSLNRTYFSFYYRPARFTPSMISNPESAPFLPVYLRIAQPAAPTPGEIRANEKAIVTDPTPRYSYSSFRMADFNSAVLLSSFFTFSYAEKSSGSIYVGPESGKCGQDTYIDRQATYRPACEFIGSSGSLDARLNLNDHGNVTYTRTNALTLTALNAPLRINVTNGVPVAVRGAATASLYPMVFRVKALSVIGTTTLHLFHFLSRDCGPTSNLAVATLNTANQQVDITVYCPSETIVYKSPNYNASIEVTLISTAAPSMSPFTIAPGAVYRYEARPQEAFEIPLNMGASTGFLLEITADGTTWTTRAGSGASVWAGSCETHYSLVSTSSGNSALYTVSTYASDITKRIQDFASATLQVRSGASIATNFTIRVLEHGDSLCTTDTSYVPTECSSYIQHAVVSNALVWEYATVNNIINRVKDAMASSYPDDAANRTPFFNKIMEQACKAHVPRCTEIGFDYALRPCSRECFLSVSQSGPANAVSTICSTLDTICSPYVYPTLVDPPVSIPVPPLAPPTVAPVPVATPVPEPIAPDTQEPIEAPASGSVAPVAVSAPQTVSNPPTVQAAPQSTQQQPPQSTQQQPPRSSPTQSPSGSSSNTSDASRLATSVSVLVTVAAAFLLF